MSELFGVSMNTIAIVAVALTLLILLVLAYLAWRNPVMFKLGLRNIPRRPAQTTLIVLGLMLSTLIMSAAFTTGDTLTRSIDTAVIDTLGPIDELLVYDDDQQPAPEDERVLPAEQVDQWRAAAAANPDIDAFVPYYSETLPIRSESTGLNEPFTTLVATDPADAEALGGLRDLDGNPVELAGNEIALNEELADALDASVGDTVSVFALGQSAELTVVAIVESWALAGNFNTIVPEGGAVTPALLASLVDRQGIYDGVFISNSGGERDGVDRTGAVVSYFQGATQGSQVATGGGVFGDGPYKVETVKEDGLEDAQLFGNLFTTIFVVFGLFSIAAGVLLIFLIFVMIAAERKPEMGMARAVGARRRHLVESFLAEGMAYDLGSAIIGAFAGIGVAYLMVAIVEWSVGDGLGIDLSLAVSPRSFIVAFCIGVIATFTVISIASVRASRLNIVAAIRDLPEGRKVDPEQHTVIGYLRSTLNGMAAFGVLLLSILLSLRFPSLAGIFLLGALVGFVGPWLYFLRGHNFALPRDERKIGLAFPGFPVWPLFTLLIPPVGIGYLGALALVRIVRDRRPRSMPTWVVLAGIIFAPLAMVLAAMQDRERPIAWSVGFGVVGGVLGVLLVQWGLDANRSFQFLLGVSLLVLTVVVTLRHFGVAERLSFTVASACLLAVWYVPPEWIETITGELVGDFEMFFLSGVVMVTCGTFIIVYNADMLLTPLARLGSGLGRYYPAVKTAISYPLTSRFRTGMTVAMIGLISFALITFSTINSNFSRIFLNDDAAGGYEDIVQINGQNRIDDFAAELESRGVDTAPITAVAENRIAAFPEAEGRYPADPGEPGFGNYAVIGVDQAFLDTNELQFKAIADGYDDSGDVWSAVGSGEGFAVLPAAISAPVGDFGEPLDDALEVDRDFVDGFEPFTLELRQAGATEPTTVTVVGVLKSAADTFWNGIMIDAQTFDATFPSATGQSFYVQLADGTDSEEYAQSIEAALVQASAESIPKILEDFRRQSQGFLLLFQGFMGLGLLVGIAALGVIAFRAVVERRQQIGMLRAIGYRRTMVALSFVLESSFVALSGILLGLVLGVSLAFVLFTTGEIDDSAQDVGFAVPWLQLAIICGIAFTASILMTVIPARSASRTVVAEALRFE